MASVDEYDPIVQATQTPVLRFNLPRPPTAADIRILSAIGGGGYGDVYEAVILNSGLKVAVKVFKCDKTCSGGIPTDGVREIGVLMELKHPHVLGMLAVLHAPDSLLATTTSTLLPRPGLWLVSELCSTDLTRYIQTRRREAQLAYYDGTRRERTSRRRACTARFGLSVEEIRSFAFQLVLALRYCHSRNIMHRDLKPQNILLDSSCKRLKIADFGLARKVHRQEPHTVEVVTLWYRPPEILLGDQCYTHAADVWSVGCILGEMIGGFPLFPGDSEIDTLYKIFLMLGTPSESDCPHLYKLPYFSTIFPSWKRKTSVYNFRQNLQTTDLPTSCIDFLLKLLALNPLERITADEAIFDEFLRPAREEFLQRLRNFGQPFAA